jgi:hypothetical protein
VKLTSKMPISLPTPPVSAWWTVPPVSQGPQRNTSCFCYVGTPQLHPLPAGNKAPCKFVLPLLHKLDSVFLVPFENINLRGRTRHPQTKTKSKAKHHMPPRRTTTKLKSRTPRDVLWKSHYVLTISSCAPRCSLCVRPSESFPRQTVLRSRGHKLHNTNAR